MLRVQQLKTYFYTDSTVIKAVDGVSFNLAKGASLAIVGESGCGKSVCSLSILRLVPTPGKIVGGKIIFDGVDLLELSEKQMRQLRGKRIAMIFQDPMTSLNPYLRVSTQVAEVFSTHKQLNRNAARAAAIEILEKVGIPAARADDYPHQFSGGMRQRVMIAAAIACHPELIIADEPTTALDVTVQAQILDLLSELRANSSLILITHDLGIVATATDFVAVMYAGRIVEYRPTADLFSNPLHPYTEGLLKSIPDPNRTTKLFQIGGQPPSLSNLPPGCAFAPRCPYAEPRCSQTPPPLRQLDSSYYYVCWLNR